MKKLLCILLTVVMFSALIACSQSTEKNTSINGTSVTDDTTTTQKSTQTTTVTTKEETTSVTEEENPFKEFYEITWLTQLNADYRDM